MHMISMKRYLSEEFSIFDTNDFLPREQIGGAIKVLSAWAVPAFIFVLWADTYYPNVEFYKNAITEGIGPNLWNAIGSFGLFSFGIALAFSPLKTPSLFATQLLSNTYAIGCLTFGLLVGQWCLLPFSELVWWQQGLFGVTSVFLLLLVFVYNLFVWYLSFLIHNSRIDKSKFLGKFEQLHWVWRAGIGTFLSAISLAAFLNA